MGAKTLGGILTSAVGDCIDHPHEQVGRCVYCCTCGKRLYQGEVWNDEERAMARAVMRLEAGDGP